MTTVTLKMRFGPSAVRETRAWYISSSDPAVWLDEVIAWGIAHTTVRLLMVPRSSSDRTTCGALVTVTDGRPSIVSQRCIAFGSIIDRLYLPVEARLDPVVSDAELGLLLADNYTYVWHAASGLIAFEPEDSLGIRDLLKFGPKTSRRWHYAEPGVTISRRLISLLPEETTTIEMILDGGQDNIGTRNDEISDLPPSPLEPKSDAMSTASRHGRRVVASIVHWFTQQVPATSSTPTWIDRVERWAAQHLEDFRAGLSAARNKELARLMHLLETDPDQGLRFAIPVGGEAYRGLAAPGNRLFERKTDFELGRLAGGDSVDPWQITADYHYQLTRRYRELANREMQLGRHRRAAYIFAELLADFDAAAGALADGRHWREAAVLYRDRLNRPSDAARCLEQGGLWMEAIALYEELAEYEKAGDLYLQLDQADAAYEQYRKAVDKHRARNDRLAAARLLDGKLKSSDEAIDELSSPSPPPQQAIQCLRELFRLTARLGHHETIRVWITRLRERPYHGVKLVHVLADAATKYPDRSVQDQAADCTRAVVSQFLAGESQADCRQLLSAVRRLVPEDRLLGRDCQRYADQRQNARISRKSKPRAKSPQLVKLIKLPGQNVRWKQACCSRLSIFAVGQLDDELILTRCSWNANESQTMTWKLEPRLCECPVVMSVDPVTPEFVLVHVVGGPILPNDQTFQRSDECSWSSHAGAIRGMSPGVVAAFRTSLGITWMLEMRRGRLTLVAVGRDGEQVSTQTVPMPTLSDVFENTPIVIPVPLHARGDRVYLGVANKLLVFEKDKPVETVDFTERITGLTGSAPQTRGRIAASFALGGAIVWDDVQGRRVQTFASGMESPVICLNRGGFLVAAGGDCCKVYSTHARNLQLHSELSGIDTKPISALPGLKMDRFGIVSETGNIAVYELP